MSETNESANTTRAGGENSVLEEDGDVDGQAKLQSQAAPKQSWAEEKKRARIGPAAKAPEPEKKHRLWPLRTAGWAETTPRRDVQNRAESYCGQLTEEEK